jgi:folate-binding protein YgfZ
MLAGVTSNVLDAPKNALLSPQGKIIGVFDQQLIDSDTCVLVAENYAADTLRKEFDKYAAFSVTDWKELDESVYFEIDVGTQLSALSEDDGKHFVFPQAVGRIIVGGEFEPNVSEKEFTAFRLDHEVPLHGVDFTDEMLLNVFPEDYVSYTKGCFVGQEVIARVHNLSDPPKKLVVKYEDQCSEAEKKIMTSKQTDSQGRVRGFVFVDNEKSGKREAYQSLKSQFKPLPKK